MTPLARFSTSQFMRLCVFAAFVSALCALPMRAQDVGGGGGPKEETAAHIQRIESEVAAYPVGTGQAPLHFTLQELMAQFHDPGLSVAVIDHFQIIWTKAYGVAAPALQRQ